MLTPRHGRALLAILVVLVAGFHAGRLLSTEQRITGGGICLPLDDSFIYLQYAKAIAQPQRTIKLREDRMCEVVKILEA